MSLRLLHWISSHSIVYDCIQGIVDTKRVYSRLVRHVPQAPPDSYVLDLGGGTGTILQHWPLDCRYICLDLERQKLTAFLRKAPNNMAVQADATLLPLASASVDTVVCTLVSHHLDEEVLHRAVQQCWRVLKPGGLFLFADAVRRPDRWVSRLMWSLDRGAYPHDMDCLRKALSKGFETLQVEQFTGYHEYAIMVLRKSAEPAVSSL